MAASGRGRNAVPSITWGWTVFAMGRGNNSAMDFRRCATLQADKLAAFHNGAAIVNEAATPKYLWTGAAWCIHQWRTSDIGGVSMPDTFTTACLDRHVGALQSEKYG